MGKSEKIFFLWVFAAILLIIGLSSLFDTPFPIFTFIWLVVPLIIVLRRRDTKLVGFKKVKTKEIIKVTIINLMVSLAIIAIAELLTHTYRELVHIATQETNSDITFMWLNKFGGVWGYLIMFLISGLVTIFGEELFFRGMLLQMFKRKMNNKIAILLQGLLFCLPHIILALFMSAVQGITLVLVYGVIIYGLVGGWAANRTNSIWPSLITANINNLILTVIYFS